MRIDGEVRFGFRDQECIGEILAQRIRGNDRKPLTGLRKGEAHRSGVVAVISVIDGEEREGRLFTNSAARYYYC